MSRITSPTRRGEWVAVELTQEGDLRANDGTLERMIRRDLGLGKDHPVFVPVRRTALADRQVVVSAMDGYVFVGAGLPAGRYFSLEKRAYVEQVLSRYSGSQRVPHLIGDADLEPLRGRMAYVEKRPSIRRGSKVEVVSGMLSSLQGVVVEISNGTACVQFSMRTLTRILALPLSLLRSLEDGKKPEVKLVPAKLYQATLGISMAATPAPEKMAPKKMAPKKMAHKRRRPTQKTRVPASIQMALF